MPSVDPSAVAANLAAWQDAVAARDAEILRLRDEYDAYFKSSESIAEALEAEVEAVCIPLLREV